MSSDRPNRWDAACVYLLLLLLAWSLLVKDVFTWVWVRTPCWDTVVVYAIALVYTVGVLVGFLGAAQAFWDAQ